jgi:PAS domain-containing protein
MIGFIALGFLQVILIIALLSYCKKLGARHRQNTRIQERFGILANGAPVLIWMAGPDKLWAYFNKRWLDFTGRTLE